MKAHRKKTPFQVFHSSKKNKCCEDSSEGWLFKEKFLKKSLPFTCDAEVLRYASDSVANEGLYLEFGVYSGKTINFIAALNPHQKIYGFDSFEGLPDDWKKGNYVLKKGAFALENPSYLPSTLNNVELIIGLFENTLGDFLKLHDPEVGIAFMHIDCDIYSSTKTIFSILSTHIHRGTVIVFDELYNYPGYEYHEYRALENFLSETGLKAEFLAYNAYHEQVVIRII